jgi:hypothetical protein
MCPSCLTGNSYRRLNFAHDLSQIAIFAQAAGSSVDLQMPDSYRLLGTVSKADVTACERLTRNKVHPIFSSATAALCCATELPLTDVIVT